MGSCYLCNIGSKCTVNKVRIIYIINTSIVTVALSLQLLFIKAKDLNDTIMCRNS